ncbi:hypothetical protein BKA67DRAFT_660941 [Truncatella angustata]|uniref:C2H2-type domain-containing protein n=1 Tax=Truncatella angustata TaxID=152316 RepID=A0A9P8UH87_9PEZI|nr:uncharacterized protein BKA67DRAFT_660941 [Truncatella angustata]KAH6652179.1 hypothetical protein BKA67DRAFT_660941 [Truncatella angustata]
MDRGLDELIEWLLTKIAFSGLEGLSAKKFVKAVKAFYDGRDDIGAGDEPSDLASGQPQDVAEADIAHASIIWKWVVKRKDVIVVPETAARVPLEEIVSLAEGTSKDATEPATGRSSTKRNATAFVQDEVHLLLSEERQWKAIAGHGPDYKRIPLFEWRALIAIASVGTKGILQGDLTRLTGQDKRSLPTRTEALARKGYIIKQQATLRGCRTSKIWLAQFSNHAKADVQRQGLPDEVLNTPAEDLRASWDPVSFSHHYTSGQVDYVAISQAFLMILKAYQAMRYCDIRPKMNITNRIPQMRALAKSSRWWAGIGVIRFEPMKTGKGGQLFKDCVKFIRDPTEEEWTRYKTMPKASLQVPTSRLRKNLKKPKKSASKAAAAATTESSPPEANSVLKHLAPRIPPSLALIQLSAWDPSKPIATTFFEIIKRSGSQGSSNTELGMFNLGWAYRKYISTLTTMISLPRSLPPHQQPFAVHSEFKRVRKTMTYTFRAHGAIAGDRDQQTELIKSANTDEHGSTIFNAQLVEYMTGSPVFPQPSPGEFVKPGSRVKGFLPLTGLKSFTRAGLKRDQEVSDEVIPGEYKRISLVSPKADDADSASRDPSEPLPPGVYYGKKNSLDPSPLKGRPRNSIVMKFVSPALRTPDFFNRPTPSLANIPTSLVVSEPAADASMTPDKRRRGGRAHGPKKFRCDKCGSSYKNINGLEYHQQKSQSACNPEWVPLPPKPSIPFLSQRQHKPVISNPTDKKSSTNRPPLTPKRVLPSRRPKLEAFPIPLSAQGVAAGPRSITVQSVTLHNVLDMPFIKSNRTTPGVDGHKKRVAEKAIRTLSNTLGGNTPNKEGMLISPRKRARALSAGLTADETPDEDTLGDVEQTPGSRRPLPSLSPSPEYAVLMNLPDRSEDLTTSRLHQSLDKGEAVASPTTQSSSLMDHLPKSTHITNSNPTASSVHGQQTQKLYGKQKIAFMRKELMTGLVLRLLEQNDQVLPGDVSLYSLVITKWSQTVSDGSIPIPEWKVFQTVLKGMDRDHAISIHHFGLLIHGTVKPISVVHKGHYGKASGPMPESISRKMTEVKSKCEELYPNPYVPAKFGLAGKELEICGELSQKYDNIDAPSSNANQTSEPANQEILTLGYDMRSARQANSNAINSKRTRPESDDSDEPQTSSRRKRRKQSATQIQGGQVANKSGRRRLIPKTGTKQRDRLDNDACWNMEVAPPGMAQALEASCSVHFVAPTTPASYEKAAALEGEVDEDDEEEEGEEEEEGGGGGEEEQDNGDNVLPFDARSDSDVLDGANESPSFTTIHMITAIGDGVWPGKFPRGFFSNRPGESFAAAGTFPDRSWFLRQNLPQNKNEMVDRAQFRRALVRQKIPRYGNFGADIEAIEAWERSPEGVYLQNVGNIAPEHIFISLRVEPEHANMNPVVAEWPHDVQFTADSLPEDIRDALSEDEHEDLPLPEEVVFAAEGPEIRKKPSKDIGGRQRRFIKRSEGNWKHRVLFPIAKRETGRWNMARSVGANIGRERETELVVAIVIIRKLLGGVDKITDWGLFLKIYPEWSISGIRKFWIRVTKERANYIEALSKKFHTAFLEAYETGEVAPLDYDNIDSYDWKSLISWTIKLETHDGIELPTTREQFDMEYLLTEPVRDDDDWRDLWFHFQTSTYDRLDAVSSLHMVTPVTRVSSSPEGYITESDLQLARSWVRALCNNKSKTTVGIEVRDKLMELGNRDKAEMNELLELSVSQLLETKVISKAFGKGFSQVFKLNNHYEIRLKKFVHVEKYSQAIAFKERLDESFRTNREVIIPTNSNDGTIMAMINLQACGRLRLVDVNFPNVPFGFEPGNYEGRKYPKRYYLFDVKVVPTDTYMYNEDLPIVAQSKEVPIPVMGPLGEIPVWCDFFGNMKQSRWSQYLCMVAFALSVKGPMTARAAVDLLHPVIEEFEAQLIMDWLDTMGLLEKVSGGSGSTVGEWWWLVVGSQIEAKDKGFAED